MTEIYTAVKEGRLTPLGNLDDDPRARANALAMPDPSPLRAYAQLKLMAIGARELGSIVRAFELEAQCERLYAQLPAGARW